MIGNDTTMRRGRCVIDHHHHHQEAQQQPQPLPVLITLRNLFPPYINQQEPPTQQEQEQEQEQEQDDEYNNNNSDDDQVSLGDDNNGDCHTTNKNDSSSIMMMMNTPTTADRKKEQQEEEEQETSTQHHDYNINYEYPYSSFTLSNNNSQQGQNITPPSMTTTTTTISSSTTTTSSSSSSRFRLLHAQQHQTSLLLPMLLLEIVIPKDCISNNGRECQDIRRIHTTKYPTNYRKKENKNIIQQQVGRGEGGEKDDHHDDDDDHEEEQEQEYIVLYSCIQERRSSHPQWDHIDEHLEDMYDNENNNNTTNNANTNNDKDNDTDDSSSSSWRDVPWQELYKYMTIRIKAIPPQQNDTTTSADNGTTTTTTTTTLPLIAHIPLYPKKLLRLPPNDNVNSSNTNLNTTISNNDPTTTTTTQPNKESQQQQSQSQQQQRSSIIGTSRTSNTIPHSLPPNSILIYYNDDTTRVIPPLYDMLRNKQIIQERNLGSVRELSVQRLEVEIEERKYTKRFDDDIFDVLGGGVVDHKNDDDDDDAKNKNKMSSHDQEEDNTNKRRQNDLIHTHDQDIPLSPAIPGSVLNEDVNVHVGISSSSSSSSTSTSTVKLNPPTSSNVYSSTEDTTKSIGSTNNNDDDDVTLREKITRMEEQIRYTKQLLSVETKMLQNDERNLRLDMDELKSITRKIEEMEQEKYDIDIETCQEVAKCEEVQFLLDVRQKKLLKGLRQIYPIYYYPPPPLSKKDSTTYSICGIDLPYDWHNPSTSDEVISSGLGFIVHLVFMCSKYLSIPLRYTLLCKSSRSAIQDDGYDIFPLFREKGLVEKEQFDRGIVLLNRNIDLLIRMRGINVSQCGRDPHILAKIDMLLTKIIEIDDI